MINLLPKNPLKGLITIAYIALVFLFLAYVAPKLVTYFLPFMAAWLISLVIKPIANSLEKVHVHRRIGVIVGMLLVIGVAGGIMFFLVSSLIDELQSVMKLILKTSSDGMPVFVKDIINILPGSLKTFALDIAERTEGDFGFYIPHGKVCAFQGRGCGRQAAVGICVRYCAGSCNVLYEL